MNASGPATFFDGVTSAQRRVTVELTPAALVIRDAGSGNAILAQWAYAEIVAIAAPANVLRLGHARSSALARLEVRDTALIAAIDALALPLDRTGKLERRNRIKVVLWSIGATVSLVLVAVFAVPEIATRLAPLVPYSVEQRLGAAVDAEIRHLLDTKRAGRAFECGRTETEQAGRAALDKLVAQLEQPAALPIPLRVQVLRRSDSNAITLPGGLIYAFQGLVDDSKTPDELAGVLAHEIGHAAHRDGTRSVIQSAGLSFLFGLLLGDFVGGGAVIIAARTVLQNSYSREVEASADAYGVELMSKGGGDPRALGTILERIAGGTHSVPTILLDHPDTKKRIEDINAMSKQGPTHPLLSEAEWSALKHICG